MPYYGNCMIGRLLPCPVVPQVIGILMSALHKRNLNIPRARFGCEVALRFMAPTNPASRVSPSTFAHYLNLPWYQVLLEWNEFLWDGDVTLMRDGQEAYQRIRVRTGPGGEWASIRWVLVRVPLSESTRQWMLEAVITEEQDNDAAAIHIAEVDGRVHGRRAFASP